jgi:lipoprotein-releasing system permease protein
MFEFQIIKRYLLPSKKRLSTSLISLISVFTISIVVWLLVVFLSVIEGVKTNWTTKLTTLQSPIRVIPQDRYFSSYYFQADAFSSRTGYSTKTLFEKLESPSPPFDPEVDGELPINFKNKASTIDLVQELASIFKKEGVVFEPYEVSAGVLKIQILREESFSFNNSNLTQATYLTNPSSLSKAFQKIILKVEAPDIKHLMIQFPNYDFSTCKDSFCFKQIGDESTHYQWVKRLNDKTVLVETTGLSENIQLPKKLKELEVVLKKPFSSELLPSGANGKLRFPNKQFDLEPILLAKSYQDAGVRVGDFAEITLSTSQTLSGTTPVIQCYIAGFYDPGMLSVGTRLAFLRQELIESIVDPGQLISIDPLLKGGFSLHVENLHNVKELTKRLQVAFDEKGLSPYFSIIPYFEFDFAKEILNQFESDQVLFTFIGIVILMLACSNIITSLILIVQEKRIEIGLLLALGASKAQIARIFSLLGLIIGTIGFCIGLLLAFLTLQNLSTLLNALQFLQGHPAIKALSLSDGSLAISMTAVSFMLILTPCLACIAGLIPARQATKIEPVEILKNG